MKKVLIIEDEKSIREFASDVLTAAGYYVIETPDAESGLERILNKSKSGRTAGNFDIVLSDIMMPKADGFEVLKRLKRSRIKMPVFIYMTAISERREFRKAMEEGADDFLTKPFTADELLKAVETQLRKKDKLISEIPRPEDDSAVDSRITSKITETPGVHFGYDERIFISNVNRSGFINIRNIVLIKSLKDYTKLVISDRETYFLRKPLKKWLSSLPQEHFILVNRSEIINTNHIESIKKLPNNTHEITFRNYKHKSVISRRTGAKLSKTLKNM